MSINNCKDKTHINGNMNTKKGICIDIITIIPLIIMVGIYLFASKYVVPIADDYFFYNQIRRMTEVAHSSYFSIAIEQVCNNYFGTLATYTGVFLLYFVAPLNRWGDIGLTIVNASVILLYFSSVYALLYSVMSRVFGIVKLYIINIVVLIYCIMTVDMCNISESFYWFASSVVHVIPMALTYIAIAIYISFNNRKLALFLASICILILSGGGFEIVVYSLGLIIFILLIDTVKCNSIKRENIFLLIVTIIGVLVNALSPANANRIMNTNRVASIVEAFSDALIHACRLLFKMIQNTEIWIFLIVLFIIGIRYSNKIYTKYVALQLLYLFLLAVAVNLPVFYGYGSDYFPPRVAFSESNVVGFLIVYSTICMGARFQKKYDIELTKNNYFVILIALIIGMSTIMTAGNLGKYNSVNIVHNYKHGHLQEYKQGYDEIFAILSSRKTEDVVIESVPGNMGIYSDVGFTKDSTNWTNAYISEMCGNHSVRLK